MTAGVDDFRENHGEPSRWVELTNEEARCLLGLKSYWIRLMDKNEQEALEEAWKDLKREHSRLQKFIWFRYTDKETP
jgi:hypothetical protein